jgi:hypothetical protein
MNFLKHIWALLCDVRGQIPSSVTDNYDALLSTTLRAYQTKLHDNITKGNKFINWLDSKGRFRKQEGGHQVSVPLMHQQNGTADIYSGYGLLDTTPQDGITTAFYDWSQLSVSIAISRKEKRQNAGKSKILDLLKAKTTQAEVSLKQKLNECVLAGRITTTAGSDQIKVRVGELDSGASGPLPLGAIIDITAARSVSLGNINGATYSFWQNQATDFGATATFLALRNLMNRTYNNCSKGTAGVPDLMVGDQIAWETYWLSMTQNERYIIDDKKTLDVLGGSDALKFRGATFVWDEIVPDPETPYNPVDASGTAGIQHGGSATASTIYFVNSESMDYVVDSATDFITTDFVRPENQDASVAQILWMGAVGTNNRRKNGVLYGISQAITG